MGKASNQKKKRRQGTGVSRADLEGQRAWEQLARTAQKLNSMFEVRKEHLAAVAAPGGVGPSRKPRRCRTGRRVRLATASSQIRE